ncbi:hypothetical protein LINPERHAP1_LOCUS6288 [Linum perenne]
MDAREFVRGFVRIDVTRPLLGRRKARFTSGEEFWVEFGYEGLPVVCFGCGLLGHPLRLCPNPVEDGTKLEDRGPWMQAEQKQFTQVHRGGRKRSLTEAESGDLLLTAAAPRQEGKKRASSEFGFPLGHSSLAAAAGLSNPQAQLNFQGASSSQGSLGPSGPIVSSAHDKADKGVSGQAMGTDLMDCSDGPKSDLNEVASIVARVGGQVRDAKVDSGADQNRPAKGL